MRMSASLSEAEIQNYAERIPHLPDQRLKGLGLRANLDATFLPSTPSAQYFERDRATARPPRATQSSQVEPPKTRPS